jgi:hypothetical protein
MSIQTQDAFYAGATPADLSITFSATPIYSLSFNGSSQSKFWAISMQLSHDQVLARSASVSITTGAIHPGAGTVELAAPQAQAQTSTSGDIQVTFDHGHISGHANLEPSTLTATFAGDVSPSCWVPSSLLADASPGGGIQAAPGQGGEVLVQDTAFVTAQCAPFASILR